MEEEAASEAVFDGFVQAFEAAIGAAAEFHIGLGHPEKTARGQAMSGIEDVQRVGRRGRGHDMPDFKRPRSGDEESDDESFYRKRFRKGQGEVENK